MLSGSRRFHHQIHGRSERALLYLRVLMIILSHIYA